MVLYYCKCTNSDNQQIGGKECARRVGSTLHNMSIICKQGLLLETWKKQNCTNFEKRPLIYYLILSIFYGQLCGHSVCKSSYLQKQNMLLYDNIVIDTLFTGIRLTVYMHRVCCCTISFYKSSIYFCKSSYLHTQNMLLYDKTLKTQHLLL